MDGFCLRLTLLITFLLPGFSHARELPDVEDLWEFALYWNQSDAGTGPSDYFAPELLCLLGGECNLIQACECDVPVVFADPDFEEMIRDILEKPGGEICRCEMAQIKVIQDTLNSGTNPNCPGSIGNLEGIQYAVNLEVLALGCGFVSDLSVIANLTKLKVLNLHDNYIDDLSPLALLTNLEVLDLFRNNASLSDLSALSGMTKLREVNLSANSISDISPLAANVRMQRLDLSENNIADLTPLANMTQIVRLFLSENAIVEIEPLSGMTAMTNLELQSNQIASVDPLEGMTQMTRLLLGFNAITGIEALAGMTGMLTLSLVHNQIADISPLSALVNVEIVDLEENLISDLSPISGMVRLTDLPASVNQISDLSPLSTLTNLVSVSLVDNQIASLETLPPLPNLEFFFLDQNQIQSLPASILERVPNLETFRLNENQVTDLSDIDVLTSLRSFAVGSNDLDNAKLATLPTHPTLEEISIIENPLSDLSPLTRLTNLKGLSARICMISDLSPIAGMTQLTGLSLDQNLLSDLSPIAGLINLTGLALDGNTISDLTPVAGLVNLTDLAVRANLITDLQPLVDNPDFGTGSLDFRPAGNPLSVEAQCVQLPILAARGVFYTFPGGVDCSTPTPTVDPSLPTTTPTPTNTPTATFTPGADSLVWAKGVDVDGEVGRAEDVAALADGSSWVTGQFSGNAIFGAGEAGGTTLSSVSGASEPSADIFVARYTPDGALDWVKQIGSPGDDIGFGVDVMDDGTCFVTGQYFGDIVFGSGELNDTTLVSYGSRDIFIAKFNPDGTLVWAKRAGDEERFQWGESVAALSDGGCVITGTFNSAATFGEDEPGQTLLFASGDRDLFLARYNSDGTLAWVKQAGGSELAHGKDVAILEPTGILVTGYFSDSATFGTGEQTETTLASSGQGDNDILIARYGLDGTFAWAKRAGKGLGDIGESIDLYADGSSLVTGRMGRFCVFAPDEPEEIELTSAGEEDVFLAKYGPTGTLVWVKQAGGAFDDRGSGVSILPDQSAFVSGLFEASAVFAPGEPGELTLAASENSIDVFAAKYKSDGTLDWATRAGGPESDQAWSVRSVPPGDAIVVGDYQSGAVFGEGESGETTLPYTNTVGGSGTFTARYSP